MEWLQTLLNGENGSAVQLVLITLLLVLGLIVIVWVVRRIAGSPARKAARGRVPRLSITDSTTVDDKRYLVLVRRDNVEHLVMIGGPTDVVVESNIVRVKPADQSEPASETLVAETPKANSEPAATSPQTSTQVTSAPVKPEPVIETAEPSPVQKAAPVVAAATVAAAASIDLPGPEVVEETESKNDNNTAEDAAKDADAPAETKVETEAETETAEVSAPEPSMNFDDDIEVLEDPEENETQKEDEASVETAENKEPDGSDDSDLEQAISAQLDSALSGETFDVDVEPADKSDTDSDNEMQRLLDELAGESKESA